MPGEVQSQDNALTSQTKRTSKLFGHAQTTLVSGFAVVIFLSPNTRLFVSPTTAGVGGVLCAVGVLVIFLAFYSLGDAIQIAPEPLPGKQLVEKGLYKYLRHPIYTGILLCVVGFILKKPSIYVLVAGAVVILFLFFKVRFEEKLLGATYPGYAQYRSRTWGLLPGLR
jgi:protein-S-isoprenylcysteine O-methyltransferase Ste14